MRKSRDGGETGKKKEKTDENSGHYVVASSRPPERQPLERRTLVPIISLMKEYLGCKMSLNRTGPSMEETFDGRHPLVNYTL